MRIQNNGPFPAAISAFTDKAGHEHYLLVVKGTYAVGESGEVSPADEQVPFHFADQYEGDPERSSVRFETEFVPRKPRADILVVGHAIAPDGRPRRSLTVELSFEGRRKAIRVIGDRVWWSVLGLFAIPSPPRSFVRMPVTYDRAYGGVDDRHRNPRRHSYERRNFAGVGITRGWGPWRARGRPLPNLEHPGDRVWWPGRAVRPVSFGFVGRAWKPRARWAGTYDRKWRTDRFPFLPEDFDERYFQGAPEDQQAPHLRGGERVRVRNMSPGGLLEFRLPDLAASARFGFVDHAEDVPLVADTLIVEPEHRRFQIHWRASVRVATELLDLRLVELGGSSPGFARARATGKQYVGRAS